MGCIAAPHARSCVDASKAGAAGGLRRPRCGGTPRAAAELASSSARPLDALGCGRRRCCCCCWRCCASGGRAPCSGGSSPAGCPSPPPNSASRLRSRKALQWHLLHILQHQRHECSAPEHVRGRRAHEPPRPPPPPPRGGVGCRARRRASQHVQQGTNLPPLASRRQDEDLTEPQVKQLCEGRAGRGDAGHPPCGPSRAAQRAPPRRASPVAPLTSRGRALLPFIAPPRRPGEPSGLAEARVAPVHATSRPARLQQSGVGGGGGEAAATPPRRARLSAAGRALLRAWRGCALAQPPSRAPLLVRAPRGGGGVMSWLRSREGPLEGGEAVGGVPACALASGVGSPHTLSW